MKKGVKLVISLIICIIGSYFASRPDDGVWYIQNPANSWSSICYAIPDAPISIKVPLLTLSIISFGTWANPIPTLQFIDVTCIMWIIIIVSLSILPKADNKWYMIYVVDSVFIVYISTITYFDLAIAVVDYYNLNLVPIIGTIMILNMGTLTSYYARHKIFILSSILMVIGFSSKLGNIYLDNYWGTCVFHICTAIGIAILLSIDIKEPPILLFNGENPMIQLTISQMEP